MRRLTYREIAADIAERIAAGEYPERSQLPSYPQLGELYGVSYWTIWRAIRLLRDELRMVYGEPGRGTFVAPRRYWLYPHL